MLPSTERKKSSSEVEEKPDVEKALAASLKNLAVREPFEKITIKEITDGANVIRVTFYNHFQDKYELLEWIIKTEILEPVHILLKNEMYREALVLIFTNLLKDKEFYIHVSKTQGQNSLDEIANRTLYNLLLHFFLEEAGEGKSAKHPWITPEYVAKYYAQSMCYVVMEWIHEDMKAAPEEMARIYEYIAKRSMWDVIDELKAVDISEKMSPGS
jgi:probable dihydroxyacetone kinase regulator